jgi:SPP1 gp7 family putative phage head morphogenesis protein
MLERLKKAEARKMVQFLQRDVYGPAYQRFTNVLRKVDLGTVKDMRRVRRLQEQLVALNKLTDAAMRRAYNVTIDNATEIANYEALWNAKTLESVVPLDVSFNYPDTNVLRSIIVNKPMEGKRVATWFKGFSKSAQKDMVKKVNVGLALGESNQAIGRRIRESLNLSAKKASYIARTLTSHTVHHAREETYRLNNDIIKGVQWLSTLDTRTSLQCIGLDGKEFAIDDGPRPPIHFNCRSTVIPITVSWQEFGLKDPKPSIRSSMDGKPVKSTTTYGKWLKRQPHKVQDQVLGKKRAQMWREGKVTIDDFVDKDYKPIPLSRLIQTEGMVTPEAMKTMAAPLEPGTPKAGQTIATKEVTARTLTGEQADRIFELRKVYDELDNGTIDFLEAKKRTKSHLSWLRRKGGISNTEAKAYAFGELPIRVPGQETGWLPKRVPKKVFKETTKPPKPKPKPKVEPVPTEKYFYEQTAGWETRHEAHKAALQQRLGYNPEDFKGLGGKPPKEMVADFWEKMTNETKNGRFARRRVTSRSSTMETEYILKQCKKADGVAASIIPKNAPNSALTWWREYPVNVKIHKQYIRAHANPASLDVTFHIGDGSRVVFHEMGHLFERSPSVQNKCRKWLAKRAGGKWGTAQEVLGYDNGVKTWKNKFFDRYTGKQYPAGFTEAFSMGFQNFYSHSQAFKFAVKDFDHFSLIHGILSGAI